MTLAEVMEYLGEVETSPSKFGAGSISIGNLTLGERKVMDSERKIVPKGETICFYLIEDKKHTKVGAIITKADLKILNPWRISQLTFDFKGERK